jgi:hypothetical protein
MRGLRPGSDLRDQSVRCASWDAKLPAHFAEEIFQAVGEAFPHPPVERFPALGAWFESLGESGGRQRFFALRLKTGFGAELGADLPADLHAHFSTDLLADLGADHP